MNLNYKFQLLREDQATQHFGERYGFLSVLDVSIVRDVAGLLGVEENAEYFDSEIISSISNALLSLQQIGVPVSQTDVNATTTWSSVLDAEGGILPIREYVRLKTRLLFDPPTQTALTEAIKSSILELEYRLNTLYDYEESK